MDLVPMYLPIAKDRISIALLLPHHLPSFQSKAAMIDNMPSQKVTVGHIDIAYKKVGKGSAMPIILITGLGATMDMWNPLLLEQLSSSNHTVIIFDNRGAG